MLIGSFFFAVMGLLTESLASEYSFTWIAAVRSAIATCIAAGLVLQAGVRFSFFRPASLWLRSLAGCAAMLCIFFAMTHYDVAVVLSLTSMYPVWVAVLGWPLLGIWPSRGTWLALAISTVGMWLIYASSSLGTAQLEINPHYRPQVAIPLAAVASIFSAVALIGLHRVKELDSRAVVAHFSAISAAISIFAWAALPQFQSFEPQRSHSLWRLFAVGIAAVLGQLFLTKAFSSGRPARVSVVGLSQVVFATGYKWFSQRQVPSSLGMLGMLLVLSATAWVLLSQRSNEDDD